MQIQYSLTKYIFKVTISECGAYVGFFVAQNSVEEKSTVLIIIVVIWDLKSVFFFKAHFYDKVKKIDFGCSEISHQKLKNLNSTNDADMYFT